MIPKNAAPRSWPWNMHFPRPTAPDEAISEPTWTSRFAFPVATDGTLIPALQVVAIKCLIFMFCICAFRLLTPATPGIQGFIKIGLSVVLGVTTFLINAAVIRGAWLQNLLLVLGASIAVTILYSAFSFEACLAIATANLFVFTNRFFLHGGAIRATAPHTEEVQDKILRQLQNRFRILSRSRSAMLIFWLPLVFWTAAQKFIRDNVPNDDLQINFLAQAVISLALMVWPNVVLLITGIFRKNSRRNIRPWGEFLRALRSYFFYNQRNAGHPFVFQSPSGSAATRQYSGLAAAIVASTIVLSAFVFPYLGTVITEPQTPDRLKIEYSSRSQSELTVTDEQYVVGVVVWTLFCASNCLVAVTSPLALCFACCTPAFVELSENGYEIPIQQVYTTENWQKLIDHLRTVDRGKFKDHFLFGVNAYDWTPIILPRTVLREHMHIVGDTGSGKTALGIAPSVEQMCRFGDCSVVVIDLKGDDQTLAEILRTAACSLSGLPQATSLDSALWKIPYRYFHPSANKPSHSFNPFQQECYRLMSDVERAEFVAQSLGLIYGTDYARKFFSDSNSLRLLQVLREHPDIRSFEELLFYLRSTAPNPQFPKSQATGENVDSAVNRLADVAALNQLKPVGPGPDPDASSRIDLMDLFVRPQSLLLSLPAATGNSTNEDTARLFLYMLIEAAQRAPRPRRQVFVIIDEFQRIVSPNIGAIMQIARSHDVALVLANQSLGDLRTASGGVVYSAITGNTRIRQYFSVRDAAEIEGLTSTSGECIIYNASFTTTTKIIDDVSVVAETVSYTPQISTKLRRNDIIEASDHANRSIFQLFRSIGVAQHQGYPFIMESVHNISKAEHERRSLLKWPAPTPSTSRIVPQPFLKELQRKNTPAAQSSSAGPLIPKLQTPTPSSPLAVTTGLSQLPKPPSHAPPAGRLPGQPTAKQQTPTQTPPVRQTPANPSASSASVNPTPGKRQPQLSSTEQKTQGTKDVQKHKGGKNPATKPVTQPGRKQHQPQALSPPTKGSGAQTPVVDPALNVSLQRLKEKLNEVRERENK